MGKKRKKHLLKGVEEREGAWSLHSTRNIFSQAILIYGKTRHHVGFLGKGPLSQTSSSCAPSRDQCLGSQRQNLSLESRIDPMGPPLICSHCHLLDYKGCWFSSNFHFSLAFYGKYTLAMDGCVPHQKDPRLFSNTSLLHSQFIYDSDESVFPGNTHFTF